MQGGIDQKESRTKQNQEGLNSINNRSGNANSNSTSDEDIGNIITLHRAGKEKKISWDQLKRPHARTVSKQFQHDLEKFNGNPLNRDFNNNSNNNSNDNKETNNSGGLLQIGGHLPNSTNFDK